MPGGEEHAEDSEAEDNEARPDAPRPKGRVRRIAFVALVVVVSLAIAFSLYASLLYVRLSRYDVDLHASQPGGRTYLVVGIDSRANLTEEQLAQFGTTPLARADIVLLLRVPADGSAPTLLSIPRDVLVLGADSGLHRLALEWLSGPQAFVDTLCRSLGVGADHLIQVELEGFIDVVDAVGGIDVDFANAQRDTVISFSADAGREHLDGERALQYVRARHLEYLNAFGWFPYDDPRDGRAQTVLRAVAAKADLGRGPVAVHRLLWAGTDAVAVDDGTGVRDLLDLSRQVRRVPSEATVTLPVGRTQGPIPFAETSPEAASLLAPFAARDPGCGAAVVPPSGG